MSLRDSLDPVVEFLHEEAAGGAALLAAAVVALVWANSPAGDGYAALWETQLVVGPLSLDLRHWINDGLMVVFFFVVGLEIKRELVAGDLRDTRTATLPALAAVGGVAAPAVVFLLVITLGGAEGAGGWAIPAATDIAFAVGVLALLGDRVSAGVRLLLLTIAIVDDILAIVIIALVYTDGLSVAWLGASVACLAVVVGLRRAGVARVAAYVPLGVLVWFTVHESGVHATLAGVLLGVLTPARPVAGRPVLTDLEHRLHPLSAFVAVPLFALANAGIDLGGGVLGDAIANPLTWAVVAGLVVGKLVGVTGAARLALRAGVGRLPSGVTRTQLPGVGAVAGIGFTVSLFIAQLAFAEGALLDRAKVGILLGSAVGAGLGPALLVALGRGRADGVTP